MDKFNPMQVNRLLSFERTQDVPKMSQEQKAAFNADIKKQAAYFMLSVSRAVESKDYKTAKSILIYIADSCSCIQDPDTQVRYLMEVCCQHLALIHERQCAQQEKAKNQIKVQELSHGSSKRPVYVFRYNKFTGYFQNEQSNNDESHPSVLFYMSKLNAILFNFQNTENLHSLLAMLKTYFPHFLTMLILIGLLFLVVLSNLVERIVGPQPNNIQSHIAIIGTCSLFLIPLIKIYQKQPIVKDSNFFEKKLGQQILKINQECAKNGEKIKFFMPEGIQINVQIDEDIQSSES